MKARNSSGVETSLPTSPISPPIEIVTPFGSRARMKRVKCAAFSKFCRCWRASVGWDMSTSVEVSMSMFRKPAGIASSMSASMARLLGAGVRGELLRVHLEVVALDEDGTSMSFLDRGGQNDRDVLAGALVGVAHLAAGDLEDEGAHVARLRRAEDGARGVVREHAEVDGRRREPARLSAPHRHVELLDGGRKNAESRSGLPDGETRLVAPRGVGLEDGAPHESIDRAIPKAGWIPLHLCQDVLDGHDGLPKTGFYFDPGRFPERWGITHEKSSAPNPAAVAARRSS